MEESLKRLANGQDLSLRELAKACNVSANAPYRHFASKEALLGCLAAHGFGLLSEKLVTGRSEGPVKQFRDLGQAFGEFAQEHPDLFELMVGRKLPEENDLNAARLKCFEQLAESVRILMGEVTVTQEVRQGTVAAWCAFAGYGVLADHSRFPMDELAAPACGQRHCPHAGSGPKRLGSRQMWQLVRPRLARYCW